MKIAVFGATGGTGKEILKQALDAGHTLTAFVRDPSKVDSAGNPNLKVTQGNVLDSSVVEQTVADHDVVISALGAGTSRTTLREDSTRAIVEAMSKAGVKRLISLSSLGVGDSRSNLDLITKHIVVDIFLRHAFADHERQESVIRGCSLDWTIVRPPRLTNGPHTGEYKHGFPTDFRDLKLKISRADVADFIVKQVVDDAYVGQSPGVSY